MHNDFRSVSEILQNEIAFKKVLGFVKDFELIENFYSLFPELKKIVQPIKIENKKLFLKVENSVWRNELKIRQELMINKINIILKREVIKSIKFI
jgi:hypothetical protein